MTDLGPLQRALDEQAANLERAAAFLSPEREAERRARFEAGMAELAAARADFRKILNPPGLTPAHPSQRDTGHNNAAEGVSAAKGKPA